MMGTFTLRQSLLGCSQRKISQWPKCPSWKPIWTARITGNISVSGIILNRLSRTLVWSSFFFGTSLTSKKTFFAKRSLCKCRQEKKNIVNLELTMCIKFLALRWKKGKNEVLRVTLHLVELLSDLDWWIHWERRSQRSNFSKVELRTQYLTHQVSCQAYYLLNFQYLISQSTRQTSIVSFSQMNGIPQPIQLKKSCKTRRNACAFHCCKPR